VEDPAQLRKLAAHCRRLAKAALAEDVSLKLLQLAVEFEERAIELDSAEQQPSLPN